MSNTFVFWIVAAIFDVAGDEECSIEPYSEQADALKRYMKTSSAAILYELQVGNELSIREVMRKALERPGQPGERR